MRQANKETKRNQRAKEQKRIKYVLNCYIISLEIKSPVA